MQFNDTTSQTNLREDAEKKEKTNILNDQKSEDDEYETVQVTKHMFVKQKKNDQENIKEIIEKHPYKRWETILDGPGTK